MTPNTELLAIDATGESHALLARDADSALPVASRILSERGLSDLLRNVELASMRLDREISERTRAEARVAYLNRVYAMLSGIHALIVRAHDRAELLGEACRIAVEAGGFVAALMGIVDSRSAKLIPIGLAGLHDAVEALTQMLAAGGGLPTALFEEAIRGKVPVVCDSQGDPRVPFCGGPDFGCRSMVVLPLIVADEAIGAIALWAGERQFFHAEELTLLTALAGDVAFALDHIGKRERIDYLASHDSLSGLANRTLFFDRLASSIRAAGDRNCRLALIVIDLERFRNINDSMGRTAGDAILQQVAHWITRHAGAANRVSRVGGDRFAVVLPEVEHETAVARLLEKAMKVFRGHAFELDHAAFRMAARVGVALFPEDGDTAETLFKNAEAALNKAKSGGERYLFYSQKMTAMVTSRLTLENRLRQALRREEFELHYQPKVSVATGRLTGAEALIRWHDPLSGLMAPDQFIPILEDTGLIYEVGRWALCRAVKDSLRWRSTGLQGLRVAVNVSPLQLLHADCIAHLEEATAIDAQAASALELEITESLIMQDVESSIAKLAAIRRMGVTTAIDDFGTGYSSLRYLAKLPVDTLKIDRTFIADMTAGPEGLAVVSMIVDLARSLKLSVVAEGVETDEQANLLRLLDCHEMQGYWVCRPVPAALFEARYVAAAAPSPEGSRAGLRDLSSA